MNGTVIDTLRYADRLKQSGVEPGQAEAMSRALNDELTEGLVTRPDLDQAVTLLQADLGTLGSVVTPLQADVTPLKADVSKLKADVSTLRTDVSTLQADVSKLKADVSTLRTDVSTLRTDVGALDARVGTLEGTVKEGFAAINEKFEGVDGKIEGLRSQNRYVFLVLALIAGLGFFNTVTPHFVGKGAAPAEPDRAVPAQLPTT